MTKTLNTIKPGISTKEADAAGRQIISQSGFGGEQGSRSGYSIGIGLPPDDWWRHARHDESAHSQNHKKYPPPKALNDTRAGYFA